ncbi:tRNA glutamyl-Q(34) synthetase GluQRS [soil metagenome]
MRVEDLDRGRVRTGVMETQLAELRWLGLDWDEGPDIGGGYGPYLQSEREDRYRVALETLAAAGLLYACGCSRREIAAAASAPHAGDEGPRYPGTCMARACTADALPGGGVALRFRVPPEPVRFEDDVQGAQCFAPARECGDFVVRRRDGVAAYQLAVTVDDAAMGITHVVRGADLLPSTARQLLLYRALGLEAPAWLHVPLLLDGEGERFAKRRAGTTLASLRDAGVSPQRIVGWLASTCGLSAPDECLAPAELLPRFSVAVLPRDDTRSASVPARLPHDA